MVTTTMDVVDLSSLSSRVERVTAELTAVDALLRAVEGVTTTARTSIEGLATGATRPNLTTDLEALDGDLAALEQDVREGFAEVETQVAEVATALRTLQERVNEGRAARIQATEALETRASEVHERLVDTSQRLEHAGTEGTTALHDFARSVREDRHALDQSVASLRDAAQSTGASAGQHAEHTRHHTEEVSRALESELGGIGQLLAQAAERLQHEVEAAVDREVQTVIREAVERVRHLFEEVLGRIHGDRDDLRGVREVLSSLFARLSSLVGPIESEAEGVTARHSELEQRAEEKRRQDEEEQRRHEADETLRRERELIHPDWNHDDV
jgi:chromosome segregation ATPase